MVPSFSLLVAYCRKFYKMGNDFIPDLQPESLYHFVGSGTATAETFAYSPVAENPTNSVDRIFEAVSIENPTVSNSYDLVVI